MDEQKCCFIGCERRGVPEEGYDFYVCPDCLDELDREIEVLALDKASRN